MPVGVYFIAKSWDVVQGYDLFSKEHFVAYGGDNVDNTGTVDIL